MENRPLRLSSPKISGDCCPETRSITAVPTDHPTTFRVGEITVVGGKYTIKCGTLIHRTLLFSTPGRRNGCPITLYQKLDQFESVYVQDLCRNNVRSSFDPRSHDLVRLSGHHLRTSAQSATNRPVPPPTKGCALTAQNHTQPHIMLLFQLFIGFWLMIIVTALPCLPAVN